MTFPTVKETHRVLEAVTSDPFIDAPAATVRELDHRRSDGIDVRLLWTPATDEVAVAVADAKSGEAFHVVVAHGDATWAFAHPFAYAAAARAAR